MYQNGRSVERKKCHYDDDLALGWLGHDKFTRHPHKAVSAAIALEQADEEFTHADVQYYVQYEAGVDKSVTQVATELHD